jgi:hypothetical protein
MHLEERMEAGNGKDRAPAASAEREVRTGGLECPRCHKSFTASYWAGGVMIQARCLSCDLKWPLPDVV